MVTTRAQADKLGVQVGQVAEKQTTVQAEGGKKGGIFDLEDQFAFYGQYHVHPKNVAIHMVFVPLLFWSGMTLGGWYGTPSFGKVKIAGLELNLNVNFLYGVMHAVYFTLLEPVAGAMYAPFVLLAAWSSNYLPAHYPDVIYVATAVWFGGWAAQFFGHAHYEGRAPALLQNLFQSVVLAVFFVWMEGIFLLGYRPKLHKRLQNRIAKEVSAYRREKAAKSRAKSH